MEPLTSKQKDIELILTSIRNKRSIPFVKGLFRTVNQLYRECIDRAQEKLQDDNSEDEQPVSTVPTVTLSQLKDQQGGEGIMTELDMIDDVLNIVKAGADVDYRYLIAVSMAYSNSLLSFLIYPHKRLQLYLVDICVAAGDFVTLQHLVNFHVILDSVELLERLVNLRDTVVEEKDRIWITQTTIDTAKRLRRSSVVVDTLIKNRRIHEIADYLRKYDSEYPIESVFDQIVDEEDRSAFWKQIEIWSLSSQEGGKPLLSQRLVMVNTR